VAAAAAGLRSGSRTCGRRDHRTAPAVLSVPAVTLARAVSCVMAAVVDRTDDFFKAAQRHVSAGVRPVSGGVRLILLALVCNDADEL
jgi:hypothetical protein